MWRLICSVLLTAMFFGCTNPRHSRDAVYSCKQYSVYTDRLVQGDFVAKAVDSLLVHEGYPTYESSQALVNAVYNMGIDNIVSHISADNIYISGADGHALRTRDVSYAIYLSLAYLNPQVSMNTLRAAVKNGRIVQDSGTGGSWPVSSDRMVWAMAAWEVYKVTGDADWLREARNVIASTLDNDLIVNRDKSTGLFHGEQSGIHWLEQVYPQWMRSVDIYESLCLGTNVIYAQALKILSLMDAALGSMEMSRTYADLGARLTDNINANLWMADKGYYSGYLYGGVYTLQSPAIDNLGQSMSVLFSIATDDMARSIVTNTPRTVYGVASDAPFVQYFWNIAAAKVGNGAALGAGLGATYRAVALSAPNSKSFFAYSGDYDDSASDGNVGLWSGAGSVAMNFRVFAGMSFEQHGIRFAPTVPSMMRCEKVIENFKYRNSVLKIIIAGTGDKVESFTIDGRVQRNPYVRADISGRHEIKITLSGELSHDKINVVSGWSLPSTPKVQWLDSTRCVVRNYSDSLAYKVYVNGAFDERLSTDTYSMIAPVNTSYVDIVPESENKITGFSCEPYLYVPKSKQQLVQLEYYAAKGSRHIEDKKIGAHFVEVSVTKNRSVRFSVEVAESGEYMIDVRYANGSGPVGAENRCAIRMLYANGFRVGALIFPQLGLGEWQSTGFSNMLVANLKQGINKLDIVYELPYCDNMHGAVNTALLDYVRIIRK